MEYLWNDGKGVVYEKTKKWLESEDENLLIAGALAAGNFARKGMSLICISFIICFYLYILLSYPFFFLSFFFFSFLPLNNYKKESKCKFLFYFYLGSYNNIQM